jgi:tRNA G46 methylase TrmB
MQTQYGEWRTAQVGPHHALLKMVSRHKNADYKRPIPHHQLVSFQTIMSFLEKRGRPIIIDSGCGTGLSSRNLAEAYPHHDVIGIDKSAARLKRASSAPLPNLLLVQGELIDQWRLLAKARLPIERHYLLYPNPWPKISHLSRRFYAHPVFTTMLMLAPYLEVRTNWRIYAEELAMALSYLGHKPQIQEKTDQSFISLFEKKYLGAACKIFLVTNQTSAH